MPVERLATDDRSRTLRALGEVIQALDDQGGMSLASREELRIDPEINLDAVILEPPASSLLQMGGLGTLRRLSGPSPKACIAASPPAGVASWTVKVAFDQR